MTRKKIYTYDVYWKGRLIITDYPHRSYNEAIWFITGMIECEMEKTGEFFDFEKIYGEIARKIMGKPVEIDYLDKYDCKIVELIFEL